MKNKFLKFSWPFILMLGIIGLVALIGVDAVITLISYPAAFILLLGVIGSWRGYVYIVARRKKK